MPRGKKFVRSRKEQKIKPKRKGKFNYRAASYIKEREARNEAVENHRKRIEEYKAKRQTYADTSSEEEEDPLHNLLQTFTGSIENKKVISESESEDEEEEDEDEESDKCVIQSEEVMENEEEEIDSENTGVESGDQDVESNEEVRSSAEDEEIELDLKEDDEEDEETAQEDAGHLMDPFSKHFRNDLDNELYQALTNVPPNLRTEKLKWPKLGNIVCQIPRVDIKMNEPLKKKVKTTVLEDMRFADHGEIPQVIKKVDWNGLYVKSLIRGNILKANYENINNDLNKNQSPLTPLQKELFTIMNNYQDLFYPERSFENESQVRFIYCLHVMNHILKTRTKILHHNAKIHKAKFTDMSEIPDAYRDQGLVRPKVLIIVPFRHSCLKIVECLISIFIGEDKGGAVINKIRFMEDFGGSEIIMPKKNPKPEDYEHIFRGNTDDSFKIGISVTKKALKLYSEFYSSDIIITSILGMRMIIGAEGEAERDYDFLASIELLIMDQTEIFFMQNWDHVHHVLDHLHLQPKDSHGTDFGRLRSWCVNGWSKYYRQSLIFSAIQLPEIHAIFNKKCHNYAGKIKVVNPVSTGSISQVFVQQPQVFQKFNVNNHSKIIDARFEFFTTKILPQFKDTIMNHTLIFVPSYFDFVKLRNYFRKEELSFVQICEYSKDAKIARARDMFFHSDSHFLLYTERCHFFRRLRIKGIRHIVFYAPSSFSNFYSELCNLMQEGYLNPKSGSSSNMTVTTIYCKYDILSLSAIVGTERASKMIISDKNIHMLMTGG